MAESAKANEDGESRLVTPIEETTSSNPSNPDLSSAMLPSSKKLQQHFLRTTEALDELVSDLNLKNRQIVELGMGEGALSKLILKQSPSKLIAYELDGDLVPPSLDDSLEARIEDFTQADFRFLENGCSALVSAPPYSELQWIRTELIDRYHLNDVLLLIPEKKRPLFADFEIVGKLEGEAFDPPSEGTHYIVKRGFRSGAEEQSLRDRLQSHFTAQKVQNWSTQRCIDELVDQTVQKILNVSAEEKFGANRRLVFYMSDNDQKVSEAKRGIDLYGIETIQVPNIEDPSVLRSLLAINLDRIRILDVLREETFLLQHGGDEPCRSLHLERVTNSSTLRTFRLDDGMLVQRDYSHDTNGHLELDRRADEREKVFGWDDIFVPAGIGKTYYELQSQGQKISSRDMVISKYVMDRIHYAEKQGLKHSAHQQRRVIDFGSLPSEFISSSELLSNPVALETGLVQMFNRAVADGAFFRAAQNRRAKNYWFPGLNAGIPLTPKRDPIHEATFMTHDIGHTLVPDKLYTGQHNAELQRWYTTYRMMSEAVTLVLADMAFVDTLKRSGFEYDYGKRKIYPLFEDLGLGLDQPENFLQNLREIMRANVAYCLRGDDGVYRQLLSNNGKSFEHLEAFKEKYMPFFVEDFRWTERNVLTMSQRSEEFRRWWRAVAPLRDALSLDIETIEEYVTRMGGADGHIVDQVFEDVFENRIAPIFLDGSEVQENTDEQRARAFCRYMMGQLALVTRFDFVPESEHYFQKISEFLIENRDSMSVDQVEAARSFYEQFVDVLAERNLITLDDACTYKEVYPLFAPFYVFYDEDKSFYEDLSTISQRIIG